MVIELEYDDYIWYGGDTGDPSEKEWFFDSVLSTGDLILHSNEVGDEVGEVKVISKEEID